MGIRIITDSTSDISKEQEKKLGITIVPLKVIFGSAEYKEGIDITIEGFYEKLVKADKLPTTSQPAPDEFLSIFLQAKNAGDSAIVLLIGGKLSGTVQSALIAKDMADYEDIYVIDTDTATTGLRTLVEIALQLRDEGREAKEIAGIIEEIKDKLILYAMVDTLEYLHKGGRLSRSQTILGSLLKFKPVITLQNGVLGVVGKERGINKALELVMDTIDENGEIDRRYPVKLGFTNEDSACRQLKEKLSKRYTLNNLDMYPVGCVVGTHVGPGACVITYIRK